MYFYVFVLVWLPQALEASEAMSEALSIAEEGKHMKLFKKTKEGCTLTKDLVNDYKERMQLAVNNCNGLVSFIKAFTKSSRAPGTPMKAMKKTGNATDSPRMKAMKAMKAMKK